MVLMHALNFRSVGPTVQPAERKQTDRHTHTHTWTLPKILPLPLTREVKTDLLNEYSETPPTHPLCNLNMVHCVSHSSKMSNKIKASCLLTGCIAQF